LTGRKAGPGGIRVVRVFTSGRFGVLFWFLVVALAAPLAVPDGPIIRRIVAGLMFVVLLSGLNAISEDRRGFLLGASIAIPAVALHWLGLALDSITIHSISQALYLLFFAYVAYVTLRWTLKRREIDVDTIYGAVSVYLLMALIWALAYYSLSLVDPGSLKYPDGDPFGEVQSARAASAHSDSSGAGLDWRDVSVTAQGTMVYFSFVTLTTLGYGDIHPSSEAARILAMLEAVLGQLYLVILVARLVGLYTTQQSSRRTELPPS
jgi:hypothetical protein